MCEFRYFTLTIFNLFCVFLHFYRVQLRDLLNYNNFIGTMGFIICLSYGRDSFKVTNFEPDPLSYHNTREFPIRYPVN